MNKIVLPIILVFVIVVSGCATGQDPVSRLCSRDEVRDQFTAAECSSELLNVYNAIQNQQPANCDLIKTEPLKLACKQAVGKMTFDEFVEKYLGVDVQTLSGALAPEDCSKADISIESIHAGPTSAQSTETLLGVSILNTGNSEIKIQRVLVYDSNNNVLCSEASGQSLLKGQGIVLRTSCDVQCIKHVTNNTVSSKFEQVVVETSCSNVVAEIVKDKLSCGNLEIEDLLPITP